MHYLETAQLDETTTWVDTARLLSYDMTASVWLRFGIPNEQDQQAIRAIARRAYGKYMEDRASILSPVLDYKTRAHFTADYFKRMLWDAFGGSFVESFREWLLIHISPSSPRDYKSFNAVSELIDLYSQVENIDNLSEKATKEIIRTLNNELYNDEFYEILRQIDDLQLSDWDNRVRLFHYMDSCENNIIYDELKHFSDKLAVSVVWRHLEESLCSEDYMAIQNFRQSLLVNLNSG